MKYLERTLTFEMNSYIGNPILDILMKCNILSKLKCFNNTTF